MCFLQALLGLVVWFWLCHWQVQALTLGTAENGDSNDTLVKLFLRVSPLLPVVCHQSRDKWLLSALSLPQRRDPTFVLSP